MIIGLRTNILNWAGLTPSLGIETLFAGQWTVMFNCTYGWKSFSGAHNGINLSTISGEVRRYFRDDNAFEGWYGGLYGRYGEHDIKLGNTGRQGYFGGGGFSTGYVWHLSAHSPFYFEAGCMIGFEHRNYRRYWYYEPTDCNVFDGHRIRNIFTLTGLSATFVWRL